MKKFFVFFLSLSLLTGCSSDDDATTGEDPILGKWFVVELNNPLSQDGLSECNLRSNIEFKADNTAKSQFYSDEDAQCQLEESNSQWSNLGNSRYSFELLGFGNQSGTVNFEGNNRFTFTNPSIPGFSIVFEKR